MSLSRREKILISILVLIIAVVAYVNWFLVPQLDSINELKSIIEQDTLRLELNESYRQKVEGMDTEIKILNQKLKDLRAEFPAALHYDEIIILLRELSQNSKVNIQNISFREPEIVENTSQSSKSQTNINIATAIRNEKLQQTLEELGLGEETDESGRVTKISNGKAFKLSLDISARATNAAIKNFFNNLGKLSIKVGINKISMNNSPDGTLSVNFSLDFYGIMDRTAKDATILEENLWEPVESGDRTNIFAGFEELAGSEVLHESTGEGLEETDPQELLDELSTYNFIMSVNPFSNNLAPPTVSLALKGMVYESSKYLIPVVYGDNKDFEKVEIVVEESEGRFLARFRTEHDSFPDSQFKNTVEFLPRADEIKMMIESTPRKFQEDTSGVIISIINNTGRKFIVDIRNDDKANSRIKFGDLSESVEINYND
jgi:type IV pilus assembly protein PilO